MTEPTSRPTPAVRATAQRHGVDLDAVRGTGVGGRITRADVLTTAGRAELVEHPTGEQAHDDELFDKVWASAPEQPETGAVFAQVWGNTPEQPETDEVFGQVFGR